MSDLEDEDVILDDIKALQAVLTQQQTVRVKEEVKLGDRVSIKPNLCEPSTSKTTAIHPSTSNTIEDRTVLDPVLDGEDSDNECTSENDEDDDNLEDLSDSEAALHLNIKIIGLLSTAKKRLQLLLNKCRRHQVIVDQKIHQRSPDALSRTLLTIAGIPYFKDKQQFPAPKNEDAKIKASRGELQIIDLPCPLRWTLKDRNTLWKAICWNARIMSEEETRKREPRDRECLVNNAEDPLRLEYKLRDKKIPEEKLESIKHLIGPLEAKEFDWLKIAATDFNGRHSANECRAMWKVFLHPDINKAKWKKTEDISLKTLAEEYNFQNWDAVARRLGTNRSGYQCFIRFNTNFKNNMFSRSSSWSKEEDQKLTDTVNALRTGNFIPWGEVAKLMGDRRKQQIYMRWNYSLAPNLKKGRFTEDEDRLLLQGVAKFGSNFTKISVALLPHRNTAQLNDHYRTLMNEKKNDWNCEDDMKLVKLFDKFGNNWSAIAKEFANKSRVQVRHRHTAIIRYLSRGLSIRTIPRWGKKLEEKDTPEDVLIRGEKMLNEMSEMIKIQQRNKEARRREQLPKIDLDLRDYFKTIYRSSSKAGRIKKFYSLEELDEKTQKLHVILNMLNADLDIPDDLEEDVFLTEKDKQLLTSLKTFSSSERAESEARHKYIEYIRRKMFGSSMPPPDGDRFIPPLPFNGKVQRTKRKKLVGLNYFSNGDKYLVELEHEINTPETIIELIGGWDSETEFQNMEKIFIGKTGDSASTITRNKNRIRNTFDVSAPSTSGILADESRNVGSTDQSSLQIISRRHSKYYPEVLIPPNYTTLLGFRGLLLSKHILEADGPEEDEYEEEITMTPEGEKALELFEERLVKLFKFPIELSEVSPPLLHGLPNGQFNDDDDNCPKKRKASYSRSGPVAKRKTKVEKVHVTETSEAQ